MNSLRVREKAAKAEQQRDDMLRTLADYENSPQARRPRSGD